MTQAEQLIELGKREIERRQKMCLGQQRRCALSRKDIGIEGVHSEY